MRKTLLIVSLLGLLCFSVRVVAAADLSISGSAIKPSEMSLAELRQSCAAAVTTVEYTSHGQKHHCTALPLLSVLEKVGLDTTMSPSPNVAPSAKHPALRMAILVRGSDGYAVIFSLAELLPSVGKRPAYLALDQDDQPIPSEQGPLKLVVPDDAGPARAVRAVNAIQIIDLTSAPSTAPARP